MLKIFLYVEINNLCLSCGVEKLVKIPHRLGEISIRGIFTDETKMKLVVNQKHMGVLCSHV